MLTCVCVGVRIGISKSDNRASHINGISHAETAIVDTRADTQPNATLIKLIGWNAILQGSSSTLDQAM